MENSQVKSSQYFIYIGCVLLLVIALQVASRAYSGCWLRWQWDVMSVISVGLVLSVTSQLASGLIRLVRVLVFIYLLGLSASTVCIALYQTFIEFSFQRVQLFLPNENILAATLVVAWLSVVTLRIAYGLPLFFLTGLAVALTGSRTAFVALIFSGGMWILLSSYSRRLKAWVFIVFLGCTTLAVAGLGKFALQSSVQAERNLLRDSGQFATPYWKKHAVEIQIDDKASQAPFGGGWAEKLTAQSAADKTVLIVQLSGETARSDATYVGSIYLRADQPQQVNLFAMGKTTCNVSEQWQRCVTPPTPGNNRTKAQLRLETTTPGQKVSLYVWGAQLEYDQVSELVYKNPSLRNYLERFALTLWRQDASISSRQKVMWAAWAMFLSKPIAGVGVDQFSNSLVPLAGQDKNLARMGHAHNFILQTLAIHGLLGFLAMSLLMLTTFWPVRMYWRKLLPLLVGLILLNLTDNTFLSGSIYYVYWLTLGLVTNTWLKSSL